MITNEILNFIKNKSLTDLPNETCGFVIENNNENLCIPVKNISSQPKEAFKIDALDFLKIKNKYKKIQYIYHSHPGEIKNFSKLDIQISNAILIPFVLYCVGLDEFNFYYPGEIYD